MERNPLARDFIENISDTARVNDIVFNRVFGGSITPKEDVKNYEQLKEWRATPGLPTDQAREELKHIHGRLVPFPRSFLKEEIVWTDVIYTELNPIALHQHVAPVRCNPLRKHNQCFVWKCLPAELLL